MAKKRKLDATVPEEVETSQEAEPQRKGSMGGMWAGSAMNMLKQRIADAHGSLMNGVISGTVALELDPEQVTDNVGSDRVTDWKKDADFEALVANIKRRGQTQPIRVRPVDPDWQPNESNPLETNDKFYIQSGRRRLEACRTLGKPVLAIISTPKADEALADLEERFHENTMRRNLNGFEELLSVGLLAASMTEMKQHEIADRLGVGQGDVSLGLAVLEFRDKLLDQVDIEKTPKRQYRAMIPKLKRGELLDNQLKGLWDEPEIKYDVRNIPMTAQKKNMGYVIKIPTARVADDHLEKMLIDLAKVVMKYQIKKK